MSVKERKERNGKTVRPWPYEVKAAGSIKALPLAISSIYLLTYSADRAES